MTQLTGEIERQLTAIEEHQFRIFSRLITQYAARSRLDTIQTIILACKNPTKLEYLKNQLAEDSKINETIARNQSTINSQIDARLQTLNKNNALPNDQIDDQIDEIFKDFDDIDKMISDRQEEETKNLEKEVQMLEKEVQMLDQQIQILDKEIEEKNPALGGAADVGEAYPNIILRLNKMSDKAEGFIKNFQAKLLSFQLINLAKKLGTKENDNDKQLVMKNVENLMSKIGDAKVISLAKKMVLEQTKDPGYPSKKDHDKFDKAAGDVLLKANERISVLGKSEPTKTRQWVTKAAKTFDTLSKSFGKKDEKTPPTPKNQSKL